MSEENDKKLVGEINKLITNILANDGGVYLPEVGSLSIEKQKKKSIIRVVKFTTKEQHRSLVSVIAERGNCTEEQAQQVYDKWYKLVKSEDTVTIAGVGTVEKGVFSVALILANRLNPKVESEKRRKLSEAAKANAALDEEQKERREAQRLAELEQRTKVKEQKNKRRNRALWWSTSLVAVIAVAVMVVEAVGDFNLPKLNFWDSKANSEIIVAQRIEEPKAEVEQAVEPKSQPKAETKAEPKKVEPKPQPKAEPKVEPKAEPKPDNNKITSKARYATTEKSVEQIQSSLNTSLGEQKRYSVVCGVLSSAANAGRLVMDVKARGVADKLEPKSYKRNGRFMITIFESDNHAEVVKFSKEVAPKYYETTWIYDKQTMK